MLQFKSMMSKLIFIMVGMSFFTTLCITGLLFAYGVQQHKTYMKKYRSDLEQSIDRKLIDETQTALSAVQLIYEQQQAGKLSEAQAKAAAADIVRNLRYNEGLGYFWIDTYDGDNVVLLGSDAEGKNRLDIVDPAGNFFIRELIEHGKQEGGGFTDAMFPKPGEQEPLPKHYYSVAFPPYEWIIGTGIWMDEVNAIVGNRETELQDEIYGKAFHFISYMLFLQIMIFACAAYLGYDFTQPILIVTERLRDLGKGNFTMDIGLERQLNIWMDRQDELGTMSRALKEMQRRLWEHQKSILDMAHNDPLTGLANRRYFQACMKDLGDTSHITLIALDLDHFKEVNDTYDHQTGDAALLILAEVLKDVFPDALNVRMGGDEFLVVFTKPIQLDQVADRLEHFMNQLTTIYQSDPELARLTISGGIVHSAGTAAPLDILLQQSDIALYQAKHAGRSCYYVYHSGMEQHHKKD